MSPDPMERARCRGTKRTGDQCTRPPIRGGTVCRMHGGAAPQVLAAAHRRMLTKAAEADALAILAHEGIEQIDDPILELGKLASAAKALTLALAQRVNALESIRYKGVQGSEQLRAEVAMYERSLDRTGKFLEVLAKLGFQERQVQVSEQIAAQVTDVLKEILDDLQLNSEQRRQAPDVVRRHMLRLVPGEAS